MNVGLLLLIIMIVLSFLGVPIFVAIGIGTLVSLVSGGFPEIVVAQKLFTGMDSTSLLAIPFFMVAGNLMSRGISQKLVNICNALFGWVKGSLGAVSVVACAFFGAVSGSGVATCSAIGGVLMPAMDRDGYDKDFTAATISASSILGMMIPPALTLIVFGTSAETSVSDLFSAAMIPGIGMTLIFVIYVLIYAKRHNLPSKPRSNAKQIFASLKEGIWALLMPVLILGSIFSGICTATESAALAVVYALIVGFFIYKDLTIKECCRMFVDSGITTTAVLMLVGLSKASSWVVTSSKLPDVLLGAMSGFANSKFMIMLLINLLLLLVGMIMESCAAVVMLTPLLLPLATSVGITPTHFGVIMSFNLCIGLITPPVGNCLMLGYSLAEANLLRTLKKIVPYILLAIAWLMAITYIPALCLY